MSNYGVRPKLNIPRTKSERIWDLIGYACFIGSILLLVFVWNKLPQEVPAHYNALGEVDRWGSKMELFILPGIGIFLAITMQLLEKFPEAHNYPARLNESNAEQFYLLSRKILNQIKNMCLFIFAIILVESISVAMGWSFGLSKYFLPILLIGTLIPIVIGVLKMRKIE